MRTHITDSSRAINEAVGLELRHARDALGISRKRLVARLPSDIGDHTLLAYEGGTRQLMLSRFVEINAGLGTDPSAVLTRSLQRARLYLENLAQQVDLHRVIDDGDERFAGVRVWASNRLAATQQRVAQVSPDSVRELGYLAGVDAAEIRVYLSQFIPAGEAGWW